MFQELIQKIEAHPSYAPSLRQAVAEKAPLVLNYHTHGAGQPFCVAICQESPNLLPILEQAALLTELVHIKGVGQTEDQCFQLMQPLRDELVEKYQIEAPIQIYLNGQPLPPA